MALKIGNKRLPSTPVRSSARRQRIAFTVSHHMTVIGRGDGRANEACRTIWRTRQASAHLGVDGKRVDRFLPDSVAAWATANSHGNHAGISIEHANSSGAPHWRVSADTLLTGAQLVAELHVKHGLGRPVAGRTMRRHSDFAATACPGPFFANGWANYVYQAQQHYDRITGNSPSKPEPKGLLMALTDSEQDEVLTILRDLRIGRDKKWHDGPGGRMLREARDGVRALRRQTPQVEVTLDADEIAKSILDQLPPDLAKRVVDELGKRVAR